MSTVKYWLWLTTRPSMRPGEAAALADHFGGPERVYFADPAEYELAGLPAPLRQELASKTMDYPGQVLRDCDRLGIRVLTIQDAQYPERLRQIDAPPAVLYVKGWPILFDEEVAIGVVGSRKPSGYGLRMAERLGGDLARRGAVVVSGVAQGIDSAALWGALRSGGRVCSVLGGGIDMVYPAGSAKLYECIPDSGLLVSEYPPGTTNDGRHFPVRNRIISGLSLGVAAVEATERSGTLITARKALDQNRDVFAFPGPADVPANRGTNLLIQRGEAKLILSAQDVLEEYEDLYPGRLRGSRSGAGERVSRPERGKRPVPPPEEAGEKGPEAPPERPHKTLEAAGVAFTDDERDILLVLGEQTLRPDDLVERTGIPARRVLSALTMLQVQGFVREKPGSGFEAAIVITLG